MECPHCKLMNPDTALRCDCGYDFKSSRLLNPYAPKEVLAKSLPIPKVPGAMSRKELFPLILKEFLNGAEPLTVEEKFVTMGVSRRTVESICDEIIKGAQGEDLSTTAVIPALLGGISAAAFAGCVWGLIAITTDSEFGMIAWAIGWFCGRTIVKFTGGQKGKWIQINAVFAALLGILMGKYFTFFYSARELVRKEYGEEAAKGVLFFSEKLVTLFAHNIGSILSRYDFLWVVFSMITALQISKGIGIKLSDLTGLKARMLG
jgi:hypothetical protein